MRLEILTVARPLSNSLLKARSFQTLRVCVTGFGSGDKVAGRAFKSSRNRRFLVSALRQLLQLDDCGRSIVVIFQIGFGGAR